VDILIFNPPYVPTSEEELQLALKKKDICASWAGGHQGRQVLDRFLLQVKDLLNHDSLAGVFYLVTISHNQPQEICEFLLSQKLQYQVVGRRKAGTEELQIFRFFKTPLTKK